MPDHAAVLCVDKHSRIPALDRTQPKPPADLGSARAARASTAPRLYHAVLGSGHTYQRGVE